MECCYRFLVALSPIDSKQKERDKDGVCIFEGFSKLHSSVYCVVFFIYSNTITRDNYNLMPVRVSLWPPPSHFKPNESICHLNFIRASWWCLFWHCRRFITFLQLADPLHQGVQRTLGLQPVGGCGVGQHALLLLQVADLLQELVLQLPKATLQQVTELSGERGAGYVGSHLLLLKRRAGRTKGAESARRLAALPEICNPLHHGPIGVIC